MEVKFELLCRVQVVQDDEAAGWLVVSDVTEVNALGRECCHRAIIVKVSTANGQILIELHLIRLLLFKVVASAAESQSVWLNRWTLNIADLDG